MPSKADSPPQPLVPVSQAEGLPAFLGWLARPCMLVPASPAGPGSVRRLAVLAQVAEGARELDVPHRPWHFYKTRKSFWALGACAPACVIRRALPRGGRRMLAHRSWFSLSFPVLSSPFRCFPSTRSPSVENPAARGNERQGSGWECRLCPERSHVHTCSFAPHLGDAQIF